jgi:prepilin signal peptidase PulO-like enzyme (type II secretory pathway)
MLYLFIVLWLIFWSFGSVLLTRFTDFSRAAFKAMAAGRSQCPDCDTRLSWHELIPVMSWLWLRGSCAHCKQQISWFYPAIEIISAWVFCMSYFFLSSIGQMTPLYMIIFTILMWLITLLAIHDRRTQTLHLWMWIDTCILTLIFLLLYYPSRQTLLLAIIFWVVFGIIYLAAKWYAKRVYNQDEWFGLGDVMLAPVIGWLSSLVFVHQAIPYSTINSIMYVCYYLVIASIVTLILFAIKKIFFWNKKLSSSEEDTEHHAMGIAFIPGMFVALLIMFRCWSRIISLAG